MTKDKSLAFFNIAAIVIATLLIIGLIIGLTGCTSYKLISSERPVIEYPPFPEGLKKVRNATDLTAEEQKDLIANYVKMTNYALQLRNGIDAYNAQSKAQNAKVEELKKKLTPKGTELIDATIK
jgi:hypothetical protein